MSDNLFQVLNIELINFRNYDSLSLDFHSGVVVITSPNGSGKTNLLEALSLLAPGKGLRNAKLKEISNQYSNRLSWQICSQIKGKFGQNEITSQLVVQNDTRLDKRIIKIDGNNCKSQAELADIFSIIWLTPLMDQLFIGPSADRRKFLDRLVYNFDSNHAQLLTNYELNLKERLKLLREGFYDDDWLVIIEKNLAELGASIAASRIQTIEHLQESIMLANTSFPKAKLKIIGEVEELIELFPSAQVEQMLKDKYREQRKLDEISGRTNLGVHRSDLQVYNINKQMPAHLCSTGEQKALLLSIILSEARARVKWRDSVPVVLLDEVIAHLDHNRKSQLFQEIVDLGGQVFLTGTEAELFTEIKSIAQFFTINNKILQSI